MTHRIVQQQQTSKGPHDAQPLVALSPMECLMYNIELGRDYPKPIVDLKHSYAKAQELLWHWRENPEVKRENYRLLKELLNNVTRTLTQGKNV